MIGRFYPATPVSCLYCGNTFDSIFAARRDHTQCHAYSCRYTTSVDNAAKLGLCWYCGLRCGEDFLISHMRELHQFRGCKQHFYFSEEAFQRHLEDVHSLAEMPQFQTLWVESGPSFDARFAARYPDSLKVSCNTDGGLHIGTTRDHCECESLRNGSQLAIGLGASSGGFSLISGLVRDLVLR
jgi:hypothetical protein